MNFNLIKKSTKWALYGTLIWLIFISSLVWKAGGFRTILNDPRGWSLFWQCIGIGVIILILSIVISWIIETVKKWTK